MDKPAGAAKEPEDKGKQPSLVPGVIDERLNMLHMTLKEIPLDMPEVVMEPEEGFMDMQVENGIWEEKLECVFKNGMMEVFRADPPLDFKIKVAFCEASLGTKSDLTSESDELYFTVQESLGTVHAFKLFSPAGCAIFRSAEKEMSLKFSDKIIAWLRKSFPEEVYKEKEKALEEFNPLLRQQFMIQVDRYTSLKQILEVHGVQDTEGSPLTSTRKDKCGILGMQQAQHVGTSLQWRDYFFVLYEGCFYYYESSKSNHPAGIIALKYATVELDVAQLADKIYSFKVVTPLRSVICKTKHEVALAEWVVAVENSLSKHLETGGYAARSVDEVLEAIRELAPTKNKHKREVEDFDPALFQNFTVITKLEKGKKKTSSFQIPKSKTNASREVSIGRDPANILYIEDKRISRAHAKIEYTNEACTFIDCGSNSGSKLNGHRVLRAKLQDGDKIKMGSTILEFTLKPKGKTTK